MIAAPICGDKVFHVALLYSGLKETNALFTCRELALKDQNHSRVRVLAKYVAAASSRLA